MGEGKGGERQKTRVLDYTPVSEMITLTDEAETRGFMTFRLVSPASLYTER